MAFPNIQATVSGIGVSVPYACDCLRPYFNIGYGTVISATATYSIQFTFSDITADNYNPATDNWFTVVASGSVAVSGSHQIPCRGMRLNVSANTGTVTVYLQQVGNR